MNTLKKTIKYELIYKALPSPKGKKEKKEPTKTRRAQGPPQCIKSAK